MSHGTKTDKDLVKTLLRVSVTPERNRSFNSFAGPKGSEGKSDRQIIGGYWE